MKHPFILIASLLLMMNAMAQSGKVRFHSINNAGLLKGQADEALQLQTINGIEYKGFFGGVGLGLDNYYFKTIPLFVDLRKNIFEKRVTPFAYLDLGANLPWDRTKTEAWSTSHYRSGFLYDMGIGYLVPVRGRWAINISAGYSEKFLNETRETGYWIWNDFPPYGQPSIVNKDTTYYKYNFRRVSLKIGISF